MTIREYIIVINFILEHQVNQIQTQQIIDSEHLFYLLFEIA